MIPFNEHHQPTGTTQHHPQTNLHLNHTKKEVSRNMAGRRAQPDDVDLSLRLKYGKHTVFMFVDPLQPFSKTTDELLDILRERYPDGLHASRDSPTTVPVPAKDQQVHVAYALLKAPSDPSQGWRNLRIAGDEKPADKNIKNNSVIAFVLQNPEDVDENPTFTVEFPSPDDEMAD
ncbi:hypothetical protein CONLIGDRAFT_686001 [Coniochaeta ligniaria NRRL 30616]|uniref:Uncharacterized protein n=1 Tax=Coniochaeta ligniaria NRRL 30616 TaxID=1408157 RepID=A0A1J7I8G3_9PEZI|nr:hypothetical protein CONLIGDRAFT_686001 [Coniochaeta ligniaria NRRL 30616]